VEKSKTFSFLSVKSILSSFHVSYDVESKNERRKSYDVIAQKVECKYFSKFQLTKNPLVISLILLPQTYHTVSQSGGDTRAQNETTVFSSTTAAKVFFKNFGLMTRSLLTSSLIFSLVVVSHLPLVEDTRQP
jgi:hypothetical protein